MADGDRSMEARIEQLVELEEELTSGESAVRDSGEATSDRVYTEGIVAGATKVPAADVPDDYPVPIETEQALRVDVDVGEGTVATYMEWDVDGAGRGHVEQLLDVLDRDPGEFAEIFGDRVALDRRGGYYGIHADRTAEIHGAEAAREDSGVRRTPEGNPRQFAFQGRPGFYSSPSTGSRSGRANSGRSSMTTTASPSMTDSPSPRWTSVDST